MIKIEAYAPDGMPDYYHLQPIVDYLIEHGNEPCNSFLWGNNRTGYFCHLKNEIDFKQLLSVFDLPDTIQIDTEKQTIDCLNTYSLIKGNMRH
jgi:hypothetical protein